MLAKGGVLELDIYPNFRDATPSKLHLKVYFNPQRKPRLANTIIRFYYKHRHPAR